MSHNDNIDGATKSSPISESDIICTDDDGSTAADDIEGSADGCVVDSIVYPITVTVLLSSVNVDPG